MKYYIKRVCEHEGCNEWSVINFRTKREYTNALSKDRKPWLCVRHSKTNEVLSKECPIKETLIKCVQTKHGKFWQRKEDFNTPKTISSFQTGNGYRVFAEDFKDGDIIKITAEVITAS